MPRGTPNAKPAVLKPTPLLADLYADVKSLPADTPYADLEPLLAEKGWLYRLVELDAIPCMDGTVVMRFDVILGRVAEDGNYALERVDSISMKMPPNPGPVSVAARVSARESVIYLLTGRLPNRAPAAASAPQAERQVEMPDRDIVLPTDDGGELVTEDTPEIRVVERREADGLPIFMDLYALGSPSKDVVNAVLDEVSQFLETATLEQITALGAKNADMMKFIKDLGTDEDVAELKAMIGKRREALTLPPQGAAMRRRAAAAAN